MTDTRNYLLTLEVDKASFDRVKVNFFSTDARNAVGVDIGCRGGHLTISPTLISVQDRSDSLRLHHSLRQSFHRFKATLCSGSHHRERRCAVLRSA